ncbi:MAG: 30S ribosomal protein S18 [Alphaproteobacteria bacterium]|nr:30S ribosomal protein S18 [Alphaproteobacteria bacterium]
MDEIENDAADSKKRRTGKSSQPGAFSGGGGAGHFFGRRKTCPFSGAGAPKIDYKDVRLLMRFISERGKIVPARITAANNKKQRELKQAIKRARFLALLPYVNDRAGA